MRKTTTSWTNRTPPLVTWLSRTDFRLGTALNTTSMWVGDSYLIPANRLTGVADVSCLGFELCSVFLYNYVDRFCCCCYWIKVVSWLCYGTLFYLSLFIAFTHLLLSLLCRFFHTLLIVIAHYPYSFRSAPTGWYPLATTTRGLNCPTHVRSSVSTVPSSTTRTRWEVSAVGIISVVLCLVTDWASAMKCCLY